MSEWVSPDIFFSLSLSLSPHPQCTRKFMHPSQHLPPSWSKEGQIFGWSYFRSLFLSFSLSLFSLSSLSLSLLFPCSVFCVLCSPCMYQPWSADTLWGPSFILEVSKNDQWTRYQDKNDGRTKSKKWKFIKLTKDLTQQDAHPEHVRIMMCIHIKSTGKMYSMHWEASRSNFSWKIMTLYFRFDFFLSSCLVSST